VISAVTSYLVEKGLIASPASTEKGATWLLRRNGRRLTEARYLVAP
jgi:hypothetical protein